MTVGEDGSVTVSDIDEGEEFTIGEDSYRMTPIGLVKNPDSEDPQVVAIEDGVFSPDAENEWVDVVPVEDMLEISSDTEQPAIFVADDYSAVLATYEDGTLTPTEDASETAVYISGAEVALGEGDGEFGSITLGDEAAITGADDGQEFAVTAGAVAAINGKVVDASEVDEPAEVINTEDGLIVGDEEIAIEGDDEFAVKVGEDGGIDEVSGVDSGTTISGIGSYDVVTDGEGEYSFSDGTDTKTFDVADESGVTFGVEDGVVTSIDDLDGEVSGNFDEPVAINDGVVEVDGDTDVTVAADEDGVGEISGVSDGASATALGGAERVVTDEEGTFVIGEDTFAVAGDDEVAFTADSETGKVNGVDGLEDAALALDGTGEKFTVNDTPVTIGEGDDVVLTVDSDGAITAVGDLETSIDGLTGDVSVVITDGDATVNGTAIQVEEGESGTTVVAVVEDGEVTGITDVDAGAVISSAPSMAVQTDEATDGAEYTFVDETVTISDEDGEVTFVTDSDSKLAGIEDFAGTVSGFTGDVAINGNDFFTDDSDTTIISDGENITGVGLNDGAVISGDLDNADISIPGAAGDDSVAVTINDVDFELAGDDDGIVISGKEITGFDSDASLRVGEAGTYTVDGTEVEAKAGDVIFFDDDVPVVYDPTDFEEDLAAVLADPNSVEVVTADDTGATVDNNNGDNVVLVSGANENGTNVVLGDGGDVAVVAEGVENPVTVKAGAGKDLIKSFGDDVTVDLEDSGAARVKAAGDAPVKIANYNDETGAGIETGGKNGIADIAQAVKDNVIKLDNDTIDANGAEYVFENEDDATSNVVNIYNSEGEAQKVGYTYDEGGVVDLSDEAAPVVIKGNYTENGEDEKEGESTLLGGSGNDSIFAGANDYIDAGDGKNEVWLSSDREENATIAMTSESGRTTVEGFNNEDFSDAADKIAVGMSDAEFVYDSEAGTLVVKNGNARTVINDTAQFPSSSSADSDSDTSIIGESRYTKTVIVDSETGATLNAAIAEEGYAIDVEKDDLANYYVGNNSGLNLTEYDGKVLIDLSHSTEIGDTDVSVDGVFDSTNVTINGINKFAAGSGESTIIGSADEANTIVAGTGGTSMRGGIENGVGDSLIGNAEGKTEFFFDTGDGRDTISSFNFAGTTLAADEADTINIRDNWVTGTSFDGDNLLLDIADGTDRIVLEDAKGKDFVIHNEDVAYVAQVNDASVSFDNVADYYIAKDNAASVTVDESVSTDVEIWLDGSHGAGFEGDYTYLSAENFEGDATLVGNSSDNVITASKGDSSLWGGYSSNNTLVGNDGADTFFLFNNTGNNETVSGFDADEDTIWLYDYTLDDFTEQVAISDDPVTMKFNDGSSLTVDKISNGTKVKVSNGDGTWTTWAAKDGSWSNE